MAADRSESPLLGCVLDYLDRFRRTRDETTKEAPNAVFAGDPDLLEERRLSLIQRLKYSHRHVVRGRSLWPILLRPSSHRQKDSLWPSYATKQTVEASMQPGRLGREINGMALLLRVAPVLAGRGIR
jgi:hypothetical protein